MRVNTPPPDCSPWLLCVDSETHHPLVDQTQGPGSSVAFLEDSLQLPHFRSVFIFNLGFHAFFPQSDCRLKYLCQISEDRGENLSTCDPQLSLTFSSSGQQHTEKRVKGWADLLVLCHHSWGRVLLGMITGEGQACFTVDGLWDRPLMRSRSEWFFVQGFCVVVMTGSGPARTN